MSFPLPSGAAESSGFPSDGALQLINRQDGARTTLLNTLGHEISATDVEISCRVSQTPPGYPDAVGPHLSSNAMTLGSTMPLLEYRCQDTKELRDPPEKMTEEPRSP